MNRVARLESNFPSALNPKQAPAFAENRNLRGRPIPAPFRGDLCLRLPSSLVRWKFDPSPPYSEANFDPPSKFRFPRLSQSVARPVLVPSRWIDAGRDTLPLQPKVAAVPFCDEEVR